MWVFTNKAFVSVVKKLDDPDGMVTVRARKADHLREITRWFRECGEYVEVIRNEGTDYPARIRVTQSMLAEWMSEQVEEIDYDNFKNSVLDRDYHDALMNVWVAMWEFQRAG